MSPCFAVMAKHGFLFFLGVEKLVVAVKVIILSEGCDEAGNLLDSVLSLGGYLFALQTQHQHSVQGIEASLYLREGIVTGLGTKFDDEWERFVKFSGIFGIARVFHQGEMKVGELDYDVFVELEMS